MTNLNRQSIGPFAAPEHGWDGQEPCVEASMLRAEVERLQQWAQQIHDALDGRQLPEYPDEAPMRIKQLRAFVQKVALFCNDSWLAREADSLAPGAELK